MLSKETEARVANIWIIIAENECSIEIIREILSQIPEYDHFQYLEHSIKIKKIK